MCNFSPAASCLRATLPVFLVLLLTSPANGDVVDPHGDLAVVSGQPFAGRFSLAVTVDDGDRVYLRDDSPQDLDTYRARFLWQPEGLTMAEGDQVTLLSGFTETPSSLRIVTLNLRRGEDFLEQQLQLKARNDDGLWRVTPWIRVLPGGDPRSVTVEWRRSSALAVQDGSIRLWIDDILHAELDGLDNSSRTLDRIHFGMVSTPPPGTRGVLRFDSFESWSR